MSDPTAIPWTKDAKVIGLISLAHGTSHFFQLVLPPLFPLMVSEFGVGYTELGIVMTVFFVTSGFGQVAAGFLVDRIGARRVLIGGLALYILAVSAFALAPAFWMFFPIAVLLGLGNCVFHPSDFTIMNASVSPTRLGRAYGMHTLMGNLGWAVAPAFMLSIAFAAGWRSALVAAALVGVAVLAALLFNRSDLADELAEAESATNASHKTHIGLAPLFDSAVVLCFFYFCFLALALIAVQSFLPPTLEALYGTPLEIGNIALTGFLLGAAAGVLFGGVLADRSDRYGLLIAVGLLGSASAFAILAMVEPPTVLLIATAGLAGFLSGMTTPSRDMLVRAATPKGATGRVFGFVYSGLDVGSSGAPIAIGLMLDGGHAAAVLWAVAIVFVLAIATAVTVRTDRPHQSGISGG